MTNKHTPLPWEVTWENNRIGIDSKKQHIALLVQYGMAKQPREYYKIEQANAEFIVGACNSHYALLEAAQEIVNDFDQFGEVLQADFDGEYSKESAIERLRTAIALAEKVRIR